MNSFFKLRNIYFILFVIDVFSCSAQKVENKKDHRTIHLTSGNKNIDATILITSKISPNRSKYYYWFTGQVVNITQGGYGGALLDGTYAEYNYPTMTLNCKGLFNKGVKTGNWLMWYENGQIKSSESWKNGWLHGDRYLYNDTGGVVKQERYRKGTLVPFISADSCKRNNNSISRSWNKLLLMLKLKKNGSANKSK